jgi:hypothetical protein
MADFIEPRAPLFRVTIAGVERGDPQALQGVIELLKSHDDLLKLLGECKDKISAAEKAGNNTSHDIDCARLQQGLRALRGVIHFLNTDISVLKHGLVSPLAGLHSSLHDAGQGAAPSMLVHDPEARKPKGTSHEYAQGHLAFALELLIRGGMQKDKALQWLAVEMARHDYRTQSGAPIASKRIASWRYDISRGKGSATAKDQFNVLRQEYQAVLDAPKSDLKLKRTQEIATATVIFLVTDVGRVIPPPMQPREKITSA